MSISLIGCADVRFRNAQDGIYVSTKVGGDLSDRWLESKINFKVIKANNGVQGDMGVILYSDIFLTNELSKDPVYPIGGYVIKNNGSIEIRLLLAGYKGKICEFPGNGVYKTD